LIRLLSVHTGRARPLTCPRRTVQSGIYKERVTGSVALAQDGLAGDEQADLRYHGGPDKAVNVYPHEHYAYWIERLGMALEPAAFGENFSTMGLLEEEVCVGDTYEVGQTVLQVTQPRQPCFKLAARMRRPQMIRWVRETGRTGFYLRCLEPGEVLAGSPITLVQRSQTPVTIATANQIMASAGDPAAVNRLLSVAELSAAWRESLRARARAEG